MADGLVLSHFRCQPIVAALAAGEVARTAERDLAPDLSAASVVNAFAVAATAWLFPSSSGHARMLSHGETAEGSSGLNCWSR